MEKRLFRIKERIFGGVCGGLGNYFDIDPVFIRALFIIFALYGGASLLLYLIMWIMIPINPVE